LKLLEEGEGRLANRREFILRAAAGIDQQRDIEGCLLGGEGLYALGNPILADVKVRFSEAANESTVWICDNDWYGDEAGSDPDRLLLHLIIFFCFWFCLWFCFW